MVRGSLHSCVVSSGAAADVPRAEQHISPYCHVAPPGWVSSITGEQRSRSAPPADSREHHAEPVFRSACMISFLLTSF